MNIVFMNLPKNAMPYSLWLKRKEYKLKKNSKKETSIIFLIEV